jgi:hypothetical protein
MIVRQIQSFFDEKCIVENGDTLPSYLNFVDDCSIQYLAMKNNCWIWIDV